jgi:hypothetical protein
MEENPFLACGSFVWKSCFFTGEEKLKERRMGKSKTKTKKNQTGMIDIWLSLFIIYGDVIRSSCLILLFDAGTKDSYLD